LAIAFLAEAAKAHKKRACRADQAQRATLEIYNSKLPFDSYPGNWSREEPINVYGSLGEASGNVILSPFQLSRVMAITGTGDDCRR
jgi:hypothetical protein